VLGGCFARAAAQEESGGDAFPARGTSQLLYAPAF
jgi:hypothetical protein